MSEFVSPIDAQCHIAADMLTIIRHADKRMRDSNDTPVEFAANHDIAKRHAEQLQVAVGEIARLLKEGW